MIFKVFQKKWNNFFLNAYLWHKFYTNGQIVNLSDKKKMDKEESKEIFYLTTHSTHFIYSYMASDIW